MDRRLLWLLAVTSLFSAGNLYYAQPILGDLARSFSVSTQLISLIPVLTQVGYVLGLLFLSPLGDVYNRRSLIFWLTLAEAVTLVAAGIATNYYFFATVAVGIGISAILVQVIIPLVATLSPVEERPKNLGVIVATALIGILLSRALSGLVTSFYGWRVVYFFASIFLFIMSALLYFYLPEQKPSSKISYSELFYSLFKMFFSMPALRRVAINGGLLYAALCTFWASLIFYLESDVYKLSSMAAGLFGLLGALGAASASGVGRYIHRYGSQKVLRVCMLLMALSFVVMGVLGFTFAGLIIGIILLDVAAQAVTVTNQNELYGLHKQAQARLNTIYKIIYFIGGASGSAASAWAWHQWQWSGVCVVGFTFVALAALWERVYKLK